MRVRPFFAVAGLGTFAVGIYANDLAAMYVAGFGYAILVLLHAIEFKVNRLLNEAGVRVADDEIKAD